MRLALAPSLALFASPADAAPSKQYAACLARAKGPVQAGVCAQGEMGRQDARLNIAYRRLLSGYAATPDRTAALRREERAWLTRRDRQCTINGDVVDQQCVVDKTARRADVLERTR